MNRKKLYYHFRDKYDLVNWIFYTEFFDEFHRDAPEGADAAAAAVRIFESFGSLPQHVAPARQDSFYEYLGQVIAPVISNRLAPYFSTDPHREFYTDLIMHLPGRHCALGDGAGKYSPQTFVCGSCRALVLGKIAAAIILKNLLLSTLWMGWKPFPLPLHRYKGGMNPALG